MVIIVILVCHTSSAAIIIFAATMPASACSKWTASHNSGKAYTFSACENAEFSYSNSLQMLDYTCSLVLEVPQLTQVVGRFE